MNFYNEIDPKAAAWLRELIKQGHIPDGVVDQRSITDIQPHELEPFTQCHFFAGIGGWSLALYLAGWPASRPVWTGSCPCQPFSSAGQGKGGSDDRHLWPLFRRLVAVQRPERVFGEQVAQAIGFNWLDGVSADLEADGYAVGAAVLGAHSVGAPHIRQRLYWMAYAAGGQRQQRQGTQGDIVQRPAFDSTDGRLGIAQQQGLEGLSGTEDLLNQSGRIGTGAAGSSEQAGDVSDTNGMADTNGSMGDETQPRSGRHVIGASWAGSQAIQCRDGKTRRIPLEPALFPLADGIPGRVGLLRGAGNAIVPQTAAEFIMACEEVLSLFQP